MLAAAVAPMAPMAPRPTQSPATLAPPKLKTVQNQNASSHAKQLRPAEPK